MIFIDYLTPKVLIADKGKKIRDKSLKHFAKGEGKEKAYGIFF